VTQNYTSLVSFISSHRYIQMVHRATTDNGTIINHTYTNESHNISKIKVIDTYYSDYDIIYCSFVINLNVYQLVLIACNFLLYSGLSDTLKLQVLFYYNYQHLNYNKLIPLTMAVFFFHFIILLLQHYFFSPNYCQNHSM